MSTIKILYFAKLRDQLDCAEEAFELASEACSVEQLKAVLCERGESWQKAFADSQVLVAVNQVMATADTQISANDEVGFFPPVTGG
jgi:sulfur-carrier protein